MKNHKSHLVLGLGATGLSVVRYLCQQGITPLVMDSRQYPPGRDTLAQEWPDVEVISGKFDCRYLVQANQIIISPGIAIDTPEIRAAVDMGIEVIGDIELFARALQGREPCVIAITGSNGKSTVTTLVGEMAKAAGINYAVGGNIGVPALDLLDKPRDLYILELSSFQLETTFSLNCIVSTCLNLSEDHMDRYRDFEAYRQAKLGIYTQSKCIVFNRQDALTEPNEPSNQNSFSLSEPEGDAWGIRAGMIVHGSTEIISLNDVALVGSHNHANLIAAMALAYQAGIAKDAMIEVAKTFKGLAHRFELVANVEGVTYVNDSKATNVGATVAALQGLSAFTGNIILIAGGDAKGADLKPLTSVLARVSHVFTLGQDGAQIAALCNSTARRDSAEPQQGCSVTQVKTLNEAVAGASKLASNGDMVLLSPACSSLDMYSSFMARGDEFCHLVAALVSGYETRRVAGHDASIAGRDASVAGRDASVAGRGASIAVHNASVAGAAE